MNLTVKIKLLPTAEQRQMLRETVKAFNEAANYVSGIAHELQTASQIRLHHACYRDIRERFGLSAQMAVRSIGKVVECLRRDRKTHHHFKPYGAMVLDNRLLSYKAMDRVSILTLQGRQVMPFVCGEYGQQRLTRVRGQADLVLQGGRFYLLQNCVLPDPEMRDVKDFLGVDLGVENIAFTSDGEQFSNELVERSRRRYANRRRHLGRMMASKHSRRTRKNARQAMKRSRGKESRFRRDTNHVISKHLIDLCKDTERGVALEDLKGIRARARFRKSQRAKMGSWAFYQLRTFIEYKAKLVGVPLVAVDPRYTSQSCSECGHREKANRQTQSKFCCRACGFTLHADENAARNIRAKAIVNSPTVTEKHLILQVA